MDRAGESANVTPYHIALDFLRECSTSYGFVASTLNTANYRRIWSRDGVICGLAALAANDSGLTDTFRLTLETLAKFVGPLGQIPSNVSLEAASGDVGGQVSYGSVAGRVDATLWYVIGCLEYYNRTHDKTFWRYHESVIAKCLQVLRAWEFNDRGLIYVPKGGDWADEYILDGYVLSDQVLYWLCQEGYGLANNNGTILRRADNLRQMISTNYSLTHAAKPPDHSQIYHATAYQALLASQVQLPEYFVAALSPAGYRLMFDTLANSLVLLTELADNGQVKSIVNYVTDLRRRQVVQLLPAFHPIIDEANPLWNELKLHYSWKFSNRPGAYHNGGIWPVNNGFFIAALACAGYDQEARECLAILNVVNGIASETADGAPRFPEYIHGLTGLPEGTTPLAWSAAGSVIAHQTVIERQRLFTFYNPATR